MHTIRPCGAEAFDTLYPIYAEAFPLSEQKSATAFRTLLDDPHYLCCILEAEGETAGFALFFAPSDLPFYLLEYLALGNDYRAMGLGSLLFNDSIKTLLHLRGAKPILIEIDATDVPGEHQETNRRRERFYRSNGCTKISQFRYVLGLITPDSPPEMEMMLYAPGLKILAREELQRWITLLYTRVYGRDIDDARRSGMFENLPEVVPIA